MWKMAEGGNQSNGRGGGDAGSSTGTPRNDLELKNLLIDLVKENPLVYDKSHRDHYKVNMRTEVFHDIGNILGIPSKFVFNSVISALEVVL